MTRINLVSPRCLTDKHLLAEYRELPRVFTLVLKAIHDGKTPEDFDIPNNYVLGKGHVTFFYNKIGWLDIRFDDIILELKRRGFDLDYQLIRGVSDGLKQIQRDWYRKWTPSPEDYYLNMARLAKRSKIDSVLEELHDPDDPIPLPQGYPILGD